ncbi:Hypothetical predicted protein [Olea europaea subsp. europaea]|uniref:Uncharacterized protein n=1 Tax=Olea europaea subsp. europaea TaxID=158383 RepID=A0A8S0QMC0_OLEEU|nr:Hypothetical predicted protein [Olea europaea subsp. europaea]
MEEQQQKNKIMLNSKAKYGVNVVDCGWTCNVYPIFVIWSKRHCQAFVGYIGSIELAAYALVSTVLLRFANRILSLSGQDIPGSLLEFEVQVQFPVSDLALAYCNQLKDATNTYFPVRLHIRERKILRKRRNGIQDTRLTL